MVLWHLEHGDSSDIMPESLSVRTMAHTKAIIRLILLLLLWKRSL